MRETYLCALVLAPLALPPDLPPVILMDLGGWGGFGDVVELVMKTERSRNVCRWSLVVWVKGTKCACEEKSLATCSGESLRVITARQGAALSALTTTFAVIPAHASPAAGLLKSPRFALRDCTNFFTSNDIHRSHDIYPSTITINSSTSPNQLSNLAQNASQGCTKGTDSLGAFTRHQKLTFARADPHHRWQGARRQSPS